MANEIVNDPAATARRQRRVAQREALRGDEFQRRREEIDLRGRVGPHQAAIMRALGGAPGEGDRVSLDRQRGILEALEAQARAPTSTGAIEYQTEPGSPVRAHGGDPQARYRQRDKRLDAILAAQAGVTAGLQPFHEEDERQRQEAEREQRAFESDLASKELKRQLAEKDFGLRERGLGLQEAALKSGEERGLRREQVERNEREFLERERLNEQERLRLNPPETPRQAAARGFEQRALEGLVTSGRAGPRDLPALIAAIQEGSPESVKGAVGGIQAREVEENAPLYIQQLESAFNQMVQRGVWGGGAGSIRAVAQDLGKMRDELSTMVLKSDISAEAKRAIIDQIAREADALMEQRMGMERFADPFQRLLGAEEDVQRVLGPSPYKR